MTLAERILDQINRLPEEEQRKVLDFVEYLQARAHRRDTADWSVFSLASAMRGMEAEDSLYTIEDLRESFR